MGVLAVVGRGEDDAGATEGAGLHLGSTDEGPRDPTPAETLGDDQGDQAAARAVVLDQPLGAHAGQADHVARRLGLCDEHLRRSLGLQPIEARAGLIRRGRIAELRQQQRESLRVVRPCLANRDLLAWSCSSVRPASSPRRS